MRMTRANAGQFSISFYGTCDISFTICEWSALIGPCIELFLCCSVVNIIDTWLNCGVAIPFVDGEIAKSHGSWFDYRLGQKTDTLFVYIYRYIFYSLNNGSKKKNTKNIHQKLKKHTRSGMSVYRSDNRITFRGIYDAFLFPFILSHTLFVAPSLKPVITCR